MEHRSEKDGFLHTLNNILTTLAVANLVIGALDWLWCQGKGGQVVVYFLIGFLPCFFCIGMIVSNIMALFEPYDMDLGFLITLVLTCLSSFVFAFWVIKEPK